MTKLAHNLPKSYDFLKIFDYIDRSSRSLSNFHRVLIIYKWIRRFGQTVYLQSVLGNHLNCPPPYLRLQPFHKVEK